MKDRHNGAGRTRPGTRVLLLGGSLAHPSHTAALLRAVGAPPRAWPSSSGPSTCSWSGPRRCSRGLLAGVAYTWTMRVLGALLLLFAGLLVGDGLALLGLPVP